MTSNNQKTTRCRLCGCDTDEKIVLGIIERGGKSEDSDVTFKPRAIVRTPICAQCQKNTRRNILIVTLAIILFLALVAAFGLFFAPSMCSEQFNPRLIGAMVGFVAIALIPVLLMFVFGEKLHYSRYIHKAYDRMKTIPAEDVLYSPKKHVVKMSAARSIIAIDRAEMLARTVSEQSSGKQQAAAILGMWLDTTTESACPGTENHEHTWNGCRCSSCGKQRTTGHRFRLTPGKCEATCSVCGMQKVAHRFDQSGVCVICRERKQ